MEDVQVQQSGNHPRSEVSAAAMWPPEDREAWLAALRGTGAPHDEAVGCLYELLVRAARAEISRRWANVGYVDDDAVDELAAQAADAALLALLSTLDDYRGDSRFYDLGVQVRDPRSGHPSAPAGVASPRRRPGLRGLETARRIGRRRRRRPRAR